MKKLFVASLVVLMIILTAVSVALADENDVYYASSWNGVLTCTRAGLRATPDSREPYVPYYLEEGGEKHNNVSNSEELNVVGQTADGGWYIVRVLAQCDAENCLEIVSTDLYIRACFVKLTPCYLKLGQLTLVYAAPWEESPCVGEKPANTVLTILAESQNWYCVQLADKTAGVGFIPKWWLKAEVLLEKPEEEE